MKNSIAYFITSHGFGHAARACAVMNAVCQREPRAKFEIFTTSPQWFFEESLPKGRFNYHEIAVDVGLVQATPMAEDLPATLRKLGEYIPFKAPILDNLSRALAGTGCRLAVCDISPIGIAAAAKAGIPSILVENFTWDWIYEAYQDMQSGFLPFMRMLDAVNQAAMYHIQASPACLPAANADLVTAPIFREPRATPDMVRQELGIQPGQKMVLVTMGGIPEQFSSLEALNIRDEIRIVVPGGADRAIHRGNLILLPHHSSFYHPDLVYAADAVVGKAGYSTISEVFHAGNPFAFITRPAFRESRPMAEFIRREIPGFELSQKEFTSGAWVNRLDELLSFQKVQRAQPNGACQAAVFLLGL
jgi:hypothetical protein